MTQLTPRVSAAALLLRTLLTLKFSQCCAAVNSSAFGRRARDSLRFVCIECPLCRGDILENVIANMMKGASLLNLSGAMRFGVPLQLSLQPQRPPATVRHGVALLCTVWLTAAVA